MAVAGCGGRQILGFGFGDAHDGTLLVRHTASSPLVLWVGDERVGVAQPGGVTCFLETPTGSLRLEARPVGADSTLTRATPITLPPEHPLLWDIDHNQVLSGRAHARLCDRSEEARLPARLPAGADEPHLLAHGGPQPAHTADPEPEQPAVSRRPDRD